MSNEAGFVATAESEHTDTVGHLHRKLVGTWAVIITFEDGAPERGLFAFTSDRLMMQVNTGNRFTGFGVWEPTKRGFRYAFRQQSFNDDGQFVFDVHVDQIGELTSSNSFTSTGTGTAIDADGNVVIVTNTTVTAERYGLPR
ncbi:MAG: hypothetical protein ACRDS9_03205 [Pseudonocardiaceae bacterium]